MVVTGCYAQIDPGRWPASPASTSLLGNLDKLRLAGIWHLACDGAVGSRKRRRRRGAHGPDGDRGRGPALSVSPYPEHPEFEGEFFSHFYG